MQKNGNVRFHDRRTGEFVCTDYDDKAVFHNHHNRSALADKLDLIVLVLFECGPRVGFEPEGSDKQFNQVFVEMVAWHNMIGRTGHEDYRVTQPDVDHHQGGDERYYRDYTTANSNDDASLPPPEQNKRWEPPPPV